LDGLDGLSVEHRVCARQFREPLTRFTERVDSINRVTAVVGERHLEIKAPPFN
jgi:hypothetical protein